MYYSEGYTVRIAELEVTQPVVNRSHLGCYDPAELDHNALDILFHRYSVFFCILHSHFAPWWIHVKLGN